jgi:hypothetical protein
MPRPAGDRCQEIRRRRSTTLAHEHKLLRCNSFQMLLCSPPQAAPSAWRGPVGLDDHTAGRPRRHLDAASIPGGFPGAQRQNSDTIGVFSTNMLTKIRDAFNVAQVTMLGATAVGHTHGTDGEIRWGPTSCHGIGRSRVAVRRAGPGSRVGLSVRTATTRSGTASNAKRSGGA